MSCFIHRRVTWAVASVGVAAAAMALTTGPASAASFDCSKAGAPYERAICADSRLSSADEDLARLYRQVMARPDMAGAAGERMKNQQRAWITQTRDCDAVSACLEPLYRARIKALQAAASRVGPAPAEGHAPDTAALLTFLRTYLQEPALSTDPAAAAPVTVAWKDLNGDGQAEAVAYLSGGWCGSGGCTLLVLEFDCAGFIVRSRTTITRLPIAVAKSATRGWSDLVVTVGGGGAPDGQVILPFQGVRYPSNPTVAPARKPEGHEASEVLIAGG